MPRRRPSKLVLALVAPLLGLVGLEAALRVRQWWRYGTASELIQLETDPATGLEIPVPGSVSGPIRIDSRGFRGPELEVPKPEGRIRLAILGGSTSFCAEVSGNEATWPQVLVDLLRAEHPGVEFDHVNGGVPGYTTVQSLVNLEQRIAPLEPDVLLVYHAKNDLKHEAHERAVAEGLLDESRARDTESTWSLTWNLFWKNVRYRKRASGEVSRPLEFEPEDLSRDFRRDLRALLDSASAHAPMVAVATFSVRPRPSQTPEEQRRGSASSLYYMPYMTVDGLVKGFVEFNRIVREETRDAGLLLIEAEEAIPATEECFADSVHFTDEGCRRMAELVLQALEADPRFQELLQR